MMEVDNWNMYAYVGNSPVEYYDPNGLSKKKNSRVQEWPCYKYPSYQARCVKRCTGRGGVKGCRVRVTLRPWAVPNVRTEMYCACNGDDEEGFCLRNPLLCAIPAFCLAAAGGWLLGGAAAGAGAACCL